MRKLKTLEHLHHAAQVPGAVGRSFAVPQHDDGHTTLKWSRETESLVCQPLESTTGQLGLRLRDLTLLWVGTGEDREFPLHGHTLEEACDFAIDCLSTASVTGPLNREPGYELDHSPLDDGATFDAGDADALEWYARRYARAATILDGLRAEWDGASTVRCWPHHFDVAVFVPLEAGDIEQSRSIGTGFSPGDGSYDEAYWYVTPWPYPDPNKLPQIDVGSWHTAHWVGAVLMDEGCDPSSVRAFCTQAHTALQEVLNV